MPHDHTSRFRCLTDGRPLACSPPDTKTGSVAARVGGYGATRPPAPTMFVAVGLLVVCAGIVAGDDTRLPAAAQIRSFADVQQLVDQYFRSLRDHRSGDLVTRAQGQAVIKLLSQAGWQVPDADAVTRSMLDEQDFLVRQLSDKVGIAFMRRIQDLPGAYDRLDRLSRMPLGQQNINDLIRKIPNGHEWIEGLTTTHRGRRLGEQLSRSRYGKDFNSPTGRIYTAEQLVARLRASYSAQRQRDEQPH